MGKTVPKGNASTYTETAGDKMGIIKRRSFLQGIAAAIFGGGVALKAKKDVAEEFDYNGKNSTSVDPDSDWAKQKPLTIEKLEQIRDELEQIRPEDGKYLDADGVECLNCRCWVRIPKGFYVPGDLIECGCGNRARFVLIAKVDWGD